MEIDVFSARKSSIWLARGHLDHLIAARDQDFAVRVFKGKYGYAPTVMLECEYYIDPKNIGPNVIKPKILE